MTLSAIRTREIYFSTRPRKLDPRELFPTAECLSRSRVSREVLCPRSRDNGKFLVYSSLDNCEDAGNDFLGPSFITFRTWSYVSETA